VGSNRERNARHSHIVSAAAVIPGVLKVSWDDDYIGLVDLRPIIARDRAFEFLQSPATFQKVKISEYGRTLGWMNEEGRLVDFGSVCLRQRAERQAELHMQAA
jgi:hypothetical protein